MTKNNWFLKLSSFKREQNSVTQDNDNNTNMLKICWHYVTLEIERPYVQVDPDELAELPTNINNIRFDFCTLKNQQYQWLLQSKKQVWQKDALWKFLRSEVNWLSSWTSSTIKKNGDFTKLIIDWIGNQDSDQISCVSRMGTTLMVHYAQKNL